VYRGLKLLAVELANDRVHTIGPDDQVAIGERVQIAQALFESELDISATAVRLEDLQQLQTRDSREPEPVDPHLLVAVHDGLIVPCLQPPFDVAIRLGVGVLEEAQRPVREDRAEAEGGVGRVLLHDPDGVRRVLLLH
jgi:hypothetical protein